MVVMVEEGSGNISVVSMISMIDMVNVVVDICR